MSALQLGLKDHVSISTELSTHSGVPLPAVPAPVWAGLGYLSFEPLVSHGLTPAYPIL